jgi:hypothetical protein
MNFRFKGKVKDLNKALELYKLLNVREYGIEKGIDISYINYKIHNLLDELKMKDIVLK